MVRVYEDKGRTMRITYPEGFSAPELSIDQWREIFSRAQRHSNITWLRDLLFHERKKEIDRLLAILGREVENIRFNNPDGFIVFATEEIEWDLELAYEQVKGLRQLKKEITRLEASMMVSFSADSIGEYQAKMKRVRAFVKSLQGQIEPDSFNFFRRVSDTVINNFCRATKQAFPWPARRVVDKSARWLDKLPAGRVRLRKPHKNAPGQ